jgi:hypothetical protein
VNNFGGIEKMCCEKHQILLNRRLGTQGPEDEYSVLTLRRFSEDFRSGTLRPVVKERSEAFACKSKLAETNIYKPFQPAGTACSSNKP